MVDYKSTLIITEILKCGYYGYNALSIDFDCVTKEDLVFFNRNLLGCLHEDTSLLRLLRVAT